jgi:hypothetical protein
MLSKKRKTINKTNILFIKHQKQLNKTKNNKKQKKTFKKLKKKTKKQQCLNRSFSLSQKVFETLFFFVVFVCCFYVLLSFYLCFDKTLLVLLRFLFFNQNNLFY